jgi:C4-dicarboxylate transporter, DctM subunit
MSPLMIGLGGFLGFFALLALGVPIALAAAGVGFIGLAVIGGWDTAFYYIRTLPYAEVSLYEFTVLPLFIIMGDFFEGGGYVKALFAAAQKWVGRIPGGLAIGTVLGGAAFAAACGSSVAASAILGKVCVPEMRKFGYNTAFASATAATSACLAVMIPPSTLMVLFGIITEVSVGQLLLAGVLPGILLTAVYVITVFVLVARDPSLAPKFEERATWGERFISLKGLWALIVLVLIIMGGLYAGIFTPTEAGAAGAFSALIMGVINRQLTWKNIWSALLDGGKNTAFVLFIIIGVMVFTRFLAQGHVPAAISQFLTSMTVPPVVIMIFIIIAYLFLGMFMSAPAMLILTLPIFFPVITSLGYHPLLFGVVVVLLCEVGALTPPYAINIFVVKGVVPGVTLEELFKAVMPFVAVSMVAVIILIAFPQISLFLPSHMVQR